ncbi:unnamed protein product [Clonostachys rosea]|uniref:Flavin reductase like domain-containing protein n=1 Tax=Bionectria ochroleuca TaxID=29856 RepID=A0ABY6ULM8_BIOOC|nr:unnamed protein product [Clonostachys rosea]
MQPDPLDGVEAPDQEASIQRNPYTDFSAVECQRPSYQHDGMLKFSKTPNTSWRAGDGASNKDWEHRRFMSIDPYEDNRGPWLNYKLLISATVPRPIALASTVSADGMTRNLAPFSFWQCVSVDPPMYSLSFTGRGVNDTLTNILATGEVCISSTADWIIEAANFASVNTPRHISEWPMSGLSPKPSEIIQPPFVAESPYSVECKLHSHHDIYSKINPKIRTATLVIVEVVRFHIWEDAIGPDRATANMDKLRPVFRAGGMMYGTCCDVFELPRPRPFRELREDNAINKLVSETQ